MNKVILIDGNNLLFRSYYATAYSGNMMKNSKGFPTNALYGFVNMLNKIITEENPHYIMIALDKGKTFRHVAYESYKEGRIAMPDDLRVQFPLAKEIAANLGIKCLEIDNYEADDIIGTFAKEVSECEDYEALIISSDKDLLQLINDKVKVKLLKTKDYILMDEATFKEQYGITPIHIIDFKGLQGDASDNIPGVKGIGEKTALKLLQEYKSLENIYANIEDIKGSLKEKLLIDRDNAFMSKQLATIFTEVPLDIKLADIKYDKPNYEALRKNYEDLEFYSFLKNQPKTLVLDTSKAIIVEDLDEVILTKDSAFYMEIDNSNYHQANILGLAIVNDKETYYIKPSIINNKMNNIVNFLTYTYDVKKHIVLLNKNGIKEPKTTFDTMIAASLLNYNIKDDIAYLANNLNADIPFLEYLKKKDLTEQEIIQNTIKKATFIYQTKVKIAEELEKENYTNLFKEIEMPIAYVLADMELTGIKLDAKILDKMGEDIKLRIEELTKEIYLDAGVEFNIASPKQMSDVLFNQMGLKSKNKKASTSKDILEKLGDAHPIVNKILEYRMLTKIYSTYIEGLLKYLSYDGRVHTIYTQTLARTGRLSSLEPNLQNIPIRYELGRQIRKAFIASEGYSLLSCDYSQIELRIFAHLAKEEKMLEAFDLGKDIHTDTASLIFKVPESLVTSEMRSRAKAINFGILYGKGAFGLADDLNISISEAKDFINNYFNTFPGIKDFMDKTIKEAYEKGYVTTITGRKRIIEELKNSNYMIRSQGERIALNTPIQGSSADILKKAMIDIYNELNSRNMQSKILLQVHDELIFECPNEEKEELAKIVKDKMENVWSLDVPLKTSLTFGVNWYEAK